MFRSARQRKDHQCSTRRVVNVGKLRMTRNFSGDVDPGTFYISAPSLPSYAERKTYR